MEKTNFCKTVDNLARCTLENVKDQYTCKFFIKASKSARDPKQCRYYRQDLGDHCDNIKAQMHAEKVITKEEEKPKTDFSY